VPWLAYGGVEIVFCSLLPWLMGHSPALWPVSNLLAAAALCVYAATGAIIGGISLALARAFGVAGAERTDEIARAASRAALALAFAVHLWAESVGRRAEVVLVGLALGLAAAPVIALWGSRLAMRVSVAAGPWATSFALLGFSWATLDAAAAGEGPRGTLAACAVAALALLGGVLSGALAARRLGATDRAVRGSWPRTLSAVVVLLLLSILVQPGPSAQPSATATDAPDLAVLDAPQTSWSGADTALPNIVLVTLDTVRADHLPLYGYARGLTPNLDAFATEATVYDYAYSPADMTLPAHASIFTGLYASWHGAHYVTGSPIVAAPIRSGLETLAERLRARGYATAAVVANAGFLGPTWGFGRGFDYYDARPPRLPCSPLPAQFLRSFLDAPRCALHRCRRFLVPYRQAGEITHEASEIISRLEGTRRPFLLFANYMDAHRPYFPPPPYNALFPGRDPEFTVADYLRQEWWVNTGRATLGQRERQHLLSQYDGGISYVDAELGRLLDTLARRGLLERSLVIITSDHGEGLGEHGLVDHGQSVYQELIHVPLLIRVPGSGVARREVAPVSTLDLFPTILAAAGIAPPSGIAGIPLEQSVEARDRVLFSESFTHDGMISWSPRFRRIERAAISGGQKLIAGTDGGRALYDLDRDPDEQHDLASSDPEHLQALETQLTAWLARAPKASETLPNVDTKVLERLRALGYVR